MTHPDDGRMHAPAAQRNREPLLAVLREHLPATGRVLEVASGTGEHGPYFAEHLPGLRWQPTDVAPARLTSIAAWRAAAGVDNLEVPLRLDVTTHPWPVDAADAVVAINMIHASPWETCLGLFRGAAELFAGLSPGAGVVILYGPYRLDGRFTTESNARFDEQLRGTDPRWGIRDLAEVSAVAAERGLTLAARVPMPANNFAVVFRPGGSAGLGQYGAGASESG